MESLNELLWDVNEDENLEVISYATNELVQTCLSLSCGSFIYGDPPYAGKSC